MSELDKLTALMSDTDALAMRVVRARVEGLLSEAPAAAAQGTDAKPGLPKAGV